MRKVFMGPDGVRAGWRFLLFLTLAVGLHFLLLSALEPLQYQWTKGWNPVDFIVGEALGIVATLIATAIAARLERRTFADYWMPFRALALVRWAEGFVWAVVTVVATFAVIVAAGGASVDGFALHGATLLRAAALWFAAMLLLGLYEESSSAAIRW